MQAERTAVECLRRGHEDSHPRARPARHPHRPSRTATGSLRRGGGSPSAARFHANQGVHRYQRHRTSTAKRQPSHPTARHAGLRCRSPSCRPSSPSHFDEPHANPRDKRCAGLSQPSRGRGRRGRKTNRMLALPVVHQLRLALNDLDELHPKAPLVASLVTQELDAKPEGKVLIFTEYRDSVERLVQLLNIRERQSGCVHRAILPWVAKRDDTKAATGATQPVSQRADQRLGRNLGRGGGIGRARCRFGGAVRTVPVPFVPFNAGAERPASVPVPSMFSSHATRGTPTSTKPRNDKRKTCTA